MHLQFTRRQLHQVDIRGVDTAALLTLLEHAFLRLTLRECFQLGAEAPQVISQSFVLRTKLQNDLLLLGQSFSVLASYLSIVFRHLALRLRPVHYYLFATTDLYLLLAQANIPIHLFK